MAAIKDSTPRSEYYDAMQGPKTGDKPEIPEENCGACNRELVNPDAKICIECARKLDGRYENPSPRTDATDGYNPDDLKKLQEAENAHNAAEIFASMLRNKFLMEDEPENAIQIEHESDRSSVVWPGGPFEWTKDIVGGEIISATEFADIYGGRPRSSVFPEVFGNIHVEPYNNCSLCFHDN